MAGPDPRILTTLHRLRRLETDAARRDLGQAITAETALAAKHAAVEAELRDSRLMSGEYDHEVFSAWYARMSERVTMLAAEMREAVTRTGAARTALANRRVAETAAEDALAREMAARAAIEARRDQLVLEDAARALKQAVDDAGGAHRRGD